MKSIKAIMLLIPSVFAVADYGIYPVGESDKNHAEATVGAKAGSRFSYGGISRDTTAFKPLSATSQYRGMSDELFKILEDVSKELFHISAQELKDLVRQDIGPINSISAQDLSAKMAQNPKLLVINVLSQNWYNDCHIAGSINIPLTEFIYKVGEFDRNQEIIVYCALDECDASEKAYILLHCMGFMSVFDYIGGIKEWFKLGLPVDGPCQASYLHKDVARNFNCFNQNIE